jgi:hypothetical protein
MEVRSNATRAPSLPAENEGWQRRAGRHVAGDRTESGGLTGYEHRLCGHRRLQLCRVLPTRLVLIVTEVANLPLDADEVRKKGVVSIALSAADHDVRPE